MQSAIGTNELGKKRYRGRFAPSPTGLLHLGSARTALVAWLRARQEGGDFVLRVEDLDPPRVVEGAADAILHDLRWLGLDWDEGPDVGGPHAPYVQSERRSYYRAALHELERSGQAYPCTCSRKEIAAIASAPHGPDDEGPRYPGTCRAGAQHPDRTPSVRFRMSTPAPSFVDRMFGPTDGGDPGDFVVMRADGVYAYQLAVVVDDLEMGITEVVRGDDLLSSTSRQIALAHALGQGAPFYLHVPLVLGSDGERLSKRHASTAIRDLRERGDSAETVVGRLAATLGLARDGEDVRPSELIARFDVSKLPRTPSVLPGT